MPPSKPIAMKRSRTLSLLVIMALSACLDPFLWQDPKAEEVATAATAPAALTVSEASVGETEWPEIIQATGSVAAWQEAVIGSEISGQRLVAVKANVGDSVKKGQVLASFNTDTLRAEYAELKANWTTAAANRKRALKLKGSGAMSEQLIDDYLNQEAVAEARLEAKALQLKYADVVAPDDGVINARTATLGIVGSPGDELFRLIRQNRLEWRGELTAEKAARVARGQPVALMLPDGKQAEGAIRQVAPSFNPETRLTTIFVDIAAGSSAKAGMYAQGQIRLGQQTTLSVPAKSVVVHDGRSYVFRIQPHASGATVSQQAVQVGQTRGGKTQILSGLDKGARIVAQGAGFLSDGDRVQLAAGQGGGE